MSAGFHQAVGFGGLGQRLFLLGCRCADRVGLFSPESGELSGVLILEFDAGFDENQALSDVREKVDLARAELPTDSEEPTDSSGN